MKTLLIAGIAAIALAGCVSPAERAEQRQRDIDAMVAEYGPACERLGYKASTDAWRDCILRLSTKDAYERYRNYPWTSTCFGHPGFYQCSMF